MDKPIQFPELPPLKNALLESTRSWTGLVEAGPKASIYGLVSSEQGLKNRRERIATAVMGTLTSPSWGVDPTEAAKLAILWADALIAELDKK